MGYIQKDKILGFCKKLLYSGDMKDNGHDDLKCPTYTEAFYMFPCWDPTTKFKIYLQQWATAYKKRVEVKANCGPEKKQNAVV